MPLEPTSPERVGQTRAFLLIGHPTYWAITSAFVWFTTARHHPAPADQSGFLSYWLAFTLADCLWVGIGAVVGSRLRIPTYAVVRQASAYLWFLLLWAGLEYYAVALSTPAFRLEPDAAFPLLQFLLPKLIVGVIGLRGLPNVPGDPNLA